MARRRLVRIPHPKIDDILAAMASIEFERLNLRKNIGRKTVYAIKALHDSSPNSCVLKDDQMSTRPRKRLNCNAA